jgi:hypothetical protein
MGAPDRRVGVTQATPRIHHDTRAATFSVIGAVSRLC